MSKIQFWKQFTTAGKYEARLRELYSICQRYNFESNLQHQQRVVITDFRCIRYVKDTILKAIYNTKSVTRTTKGLYSICQRYNFESNLQLCALAIFFRLSCIRYVKDTILKAIYNWVSWIRDNHNAVFDMSKIQFWKQFTTRTISSKTVESLYSICQRYNFESNLQLALIVLPQQDAVFDMSKIQFWKQFTTLFSPFLKTESLYSICQRYNFESNLQRSSSTATFRASCIRYVKDTILKAIYNYRI